MFPHIHTQTKQDPSPISFSVIALSTKNMALNLTWQTFNTGNVEVWVNISPIVCLYGTFEQFMSAMYEWTLMLICLDFKIVKLNEIVLRRECTVIAIIFYVTASLVWSSLSFRFAVVVAAVQHTLQVQSAFELKYSYIFFVFRPFTLNEQM